MPRKKSNPSNQKSNHSGKHTEHLKSPERSHDLTQISIVPAISFFPKVDGSAGSTKESDNPQTASHDPEHTRTSRSTRTLRLLTVNRTHPRRIRNLSLPPRRRSNHRILPLNHRRTLRHPPLRRRRGRLSGRNSLLLPSRDSPELRTRRHHRTRRRLNRRLSGHIRTASISTHTQILATTPRKVQQPITTTARNPPFPHKQQNQHRWFAGFTTRSLALILFRWTYLHLLASQRRQIGQPSLLLSIKECHAPEGL